MKTIFWTWFILTWPACGVAMYSDAQYNGWFAFHDFEDGFMCLFVFPFLAFVLVACLMKDLIKN